MGFVGGYENSGSTGYFIELERSMNVMMMRLTRATSIVGGIIAWPTVVFFSNGQL